MILSFGPGSGDALTTVFALSVPSFIGLFCYILASQPSERFKPTLRTALVLGWMAHGVAIFVDMAGIGSSVPGARFGFAPALSMTLWTVLAVYGIESRSVPLPGARRMLAIVGAVVVVLAWLFPGELRPQAPSPWAPVHWALGLASYGLFGVAVLHAVMLSRAERRMRQRDVGAAPLAAPRGVPLLRLERLTYRFVAAGFVFLSATVLLGAWYADPWRWDHKTVLSILGWIVFAALLAGRRAFGWRGPKATGWLYAGAVLLLLAYVGSRFVFEVLLHRMPAA